MIVEGAGGLLVRLDTDGGTLLDLAASLARRTSPSRSSSWSRPGSAPSTTPSSPSAPCAPAGSSRPAWSSAPGPPIPGWPSGATSRTCPGSPACPLLAVLPDGAGALTREEFVAQADRLRVGRRLRRPSGRPIDAGRRGTHRRRQALLVSAAPRLGCLLLGGILGPDRPVRPPVPAATTRASQLASTSSTVRCSGDTAEPRVRVRRASTPTSGNSSAIIQRAPSTASSTWPSRPSGILIGS